MDVSARTATDHELEAVAAIAEFDHAELRPLRGGEIWSQWEARTEPLLPSLRHTHERDDAELFVGLIDTAVVGFAAVQRQPLHDGRAIGHLTEIYVLPDARGVGVGEALMGAVEEWCRARDCVGIDSVALPGDRATKNFFESFGLVARALRVHRAL